MRKGGIPPKETLQNGFHELRTMYHKPSPSWPLTQSLCKLDKPLKVQYHDCSSILIGVPFGGTMSKVSHAETSMATSDIGLPASSLTTSEAEPAPFKKSRLRDKSDQTQALPALKHCMPVLHCFFFFFNYLAFHWVKEDCTCVSKHVVKTKPLKPSFVSKPAHNRSNIHYGAGVWRETEQLQNESCRSRSRIN